MTHARLLLVVAAVASVAAVSAVAAATSVTLDLEGGYGNRTLKACGITHHYTLYHGERAIGVRGAVVPAPAAAFRVKLKVKQCVRGSFRTVWVGNAQVSSDGTFDGAIPPRRRAFFFARAYYERATPIKSDKQYFRVG